jgi:hypothetical protein
MLPDNFGRRIVAALADSTPAFQAAPSCREPQTFHRRVLSAVADTTPAFFETPDHGAFALQDSLQVTPAIAAFADTFRTHSGADRLFSRHWLSSTFLSDLETLTSCSVLIRQIAYALLQHPISAEKKHLVQQANELLTRLGTYDEHHQHEGTTNPARYLLTNIASNPSDRRFAQLALNTARGLIDAVNQLLVLTLTEGLVEPDFMVHYRQTTPYLTASEHVALFTYWSYSLRTDLGTLRSIVSNRGRLRESKVIGHAWEIESPFFLALQLSTRRISESVVDMSGADLSRENLEDINLTGIQWSRSTTWPADWEREIEFRSVEIQPGLFEIRNGVGTREEAARDL